MQGFSWVLFAIGILSQLTTLFFGDIHFGVVPRSTVGASTRLIVELIIWAVAVRTGFELTLVTSTSDIATDTNGETLIWMTRAVTGVI